MMLLILFQLFFINQGYNKLQKFTMMNMPEILHNWSRDSKGELLTKKMLGHISCNSTSEIPLSSLMRTTVPTLSMTGVKCVYPWNHLSFTALAQWYVSKGQRGSGWNLPRRWCGIKQIHISWTTARHSQTSKTSNILTDCFWIIMMTGQWWWPISGKSIRNIQGRNTYWVRREQIQKNQGCSIKRWCSWSYYLGWIHGLWTHASYGHWVTFTTIFLGD